MQYLLSLLALTALAVGSASAATIAQPETNVATVDDAEGVSSRALVTLCDQYAYHKDHGYEFNNNMWNRGAASSGWQCTHYHGPSASGVSWFADWEWWGNDQAVKSYPYANRVFNRRLVSQINSLPTKALWSYDRTDIRANVAYDIFTHSNINAGSSHGEYELMIWLGNYGGAWPISENPTGAPLETVTIGGYRFDLHRGWNNGMRVYSFLTAQGPITNFETDVMHFFRHLTSRYGFPAHQQHMLIYQFGTEPFYGPKARFTVPHFEAHVY